MTKREIEEEMRSTAMSIVNAFDLEFDDSDLQNFYAMLVGSFLHYYNLGKKANPKLRNREAWIVRAKRELEGKQ